MGLTKIEHYTVEQNELAVLTKALGHPARIAILKHLISIDQCICGDLVEELPLSQATVSQHLKALKEAKLIKGNIEGTSMCYCIDAKNWKRAKEILNQMFDSYSDANCC